MSVKGKKGGHSGKWSAYTGGKILPEWWCDGGGGTRYLP